MFEDLVNELSKKLRENEQKMMIEDIIEIYEGDYPTYEKYYNQKLKEIEQARKMNEEHYTESPYTFRYTPEPIILDKQIFIFIKDLAHARR